MAPRQWLERIFPELLQRYLLDKMLIRPFGIELMSPPIVAMPRSFFKEDQRILNKDLTVWLDGSSLPTPVSCPPLGGRHQRIARHARHSKTMVN